MEFEAINVALALGALLVILAGCELFTNAIEWLGAKLKLSTGACGSVLAAVGTALPETIVPIVAILIIRTGGAEEVGIGAILGAPFMLATLAFTVTAIAVLGYTRSGRRRSAEMAVDFQVLSHDLGYFIVVYVVAIAASFLPWHAAKLAVAGLLVLVYAYYVWLHFRTGTCIADEFEMSPLRIAPNHEEPRLRWVLAQTLLALACIFLGAHVFVEHLTRLAETAAVSPLVLSIIITPIATELPEKFNSVTWIRQRKDTLALGNISGAMVFQSSILPAIGLVFTQWVLDTQALATAIAALAASIFAWAELTWRKRLSPYTLLAGILFYAAYIIYTFSRNPHG